MHRLILKELISRSDHRLSSARSLFDSHGRKHDYLRISLTERCNLRCLYCMPEEGIKLTERAQCLKLDELKRLSDIFVRLSGVNKIRLTGGEPTVDTKLVPLLKHLNNLRRYGLESIAMTSNGLTLKRHAMLYKSSGLDAINISLDTLKEDKFETLTRRKGLNLVLEGLRSALDAEFEKIKLNCVVMKGFNDDEILDFAELALKYPIEVRFIEFMPFAGNKWANNRMLPYSKMLKVVRGKFPNLTRVESGMNSVSKTYRDESMLGSIGFISSMSDNFCSGCNRLRITADGHLKVCLFGNEETSLRDLLRNGARNDEVVKAISSSLQRKKAQHAGALLPQQVSRPMIKIDFKRANHTKGGEDDKSYPTDFSHLNAKGEVRMVDIRSKAQITRTATSQGKIFVGDEVLERLYEGTFKKGDIISVSKVAGIMGAKMTSNLIPLCHQVPLESINVDIVPCKKSASLIVTATARARYGTGVEMESLTSVAITLLTLYDMCKSVNKSMIISEVKLLSKIKEKVAQ